MGVIPSSGPISISQISQELVYGSYSLRALSANAGKSTPDSMSEFYGYSLPTAYVTLHETVPFLENVDSYGQFNAQGPEFGTINEGYGIGTTNTEKGNNQGTFLTNGGTSTANVHGKTNVTIFSYSHTYGSGPPRYPIYSYINVNGTRVANANCPDGFMQIYYTFTATPGATYDCEFGLAYGSV
jgi:hypothetical protein